jgi:hypothetical protein
MTNSCKKMNIINTGEYYRIFGDGIRVGKELDAAAYEVVFIQNQGFFLKLARVPDARDIHVYGRMKERVEKVMRSYKASTQNLGVILSGAKGIGKSLFAKLISYRAIEEGLPVIMVNEYFEGLPQFLASIDQRCMVLFDEFDKNFFNPSTETNDHTSVQDSFLTLFDGPVGKVVFSDSAGRAVGDEKQQGRFRPLAGIRGLYTMSRCSAASYTSFSWSDCRYWSDSSHSTGSTAT